MQYGNIVQHNQSSWPPTLFIIFSLSENEHKIISLSIEDLGTTTCHNQR